MKIYLKRFSLPDAKTEQRWLFDTDVSKKARLNNVYQTFYPFGLFSGYEIAPELIFSPITILYGYNGSGKSTLLNLMAKKTGLNHMSPFGTTDFFSDYCDLCHAVYDYIPRESKIIRSDDIFKALYDKRRINGMIDDERKGVRQRRSEIMTEIAQDHSVLLLQGLDDYDRWMEYHEVIKESSSKYIIKRAEKNLVQHSNGETAFEYLTDQITEDAMYLLDEPENSLSPAFQLELKSYIEDSARFFNCQFIISTHSPLLLSLEGATVYNLDDECKVYNWYDLESIKTYASFFRENEDVLGLKI